MCDMLLFVGPTAICRSVTGCSLPWKCPARREPQHGCDLCPTRDPKDYTAYRKARASASASSREACLTPPVFAVWVRRGFSKGLPPLDSNE